METFFNLDSECFAMVGIDSDGIFEMFKYVFHMRVLVGGVA